MAEIPVEWFKTSSDMDREEIVRFQVLLYCHLYGIRITQTELECLTLIGCWGAKKLNQVATDLWDRKMFASSQSARNTIDLLEDRKLVLKQGKHLKVVMLHPNMKVKNEGNIIVDVKAYSRA